VTGVERESEKLAGIFECEPGLVKKIKSAALFHDITKEFDWDRQLEICDKYNIELSDDDKLVKSEWHAKTGAYIAKHEFGAGDIIFDAVYNHTFGADYGSFDLPGKIIYLADWIEPNRDNQDCTDVRDYFYKKLESAESLEDKYKILDETILFSFNKTIRALIDDNIFIHNVRCRNSFLTGVQKI
jgi:nicotinate-nucleotide adenylyltransferase